MKKYIIYIGILAVGLLLGWFFFGNSSAKETEHNHSETAETNQMWTCSMHPQIMQAEAGDCPICGMDLIPAESSVEGLNANEIKLTENAMALANIQTYTVGEEDIIKENNKQGLQLSGKIQENEMAEETQVSHFSGRIEKLNINFVGETVQKGQLLATVYSPELVATQQELITTATLKASQPDLYKAARGKLKLWKLSENQINQIERSGKIIDNFSIYAEVSGTVSEMMVQKGDYINRGQGMFKIDNLNSFWAIFDVYENQIADIKVGIPIKITTNAYSNKTFDGSISFIYPTLDEKTRTIKVRANLTNNGKLKPGMFVEGIIKNSQLNTNLSISIPTSAVLWTGKRSVVYVKTNPNEPIFELREVELGTQVGKMYVVLSGLEYGEEIVTNGTFTVDAAAQLQGKKSMMNKEGGKTMTGHEGHLEMETSTSMKNKNHSNMTKRMKVPKDFQNQLKVVSNDYIKLKNNLVKSNSQQIKANAIQMLSSLAKVDMKHLKNGTAHKQWMTLVKEIKKNTERISNTTDIKKQRQYFKPLSDHLIRAIKSFGINQKIYQQFCPMADNNKGAYWLSKEEKIQNPYFGEKMLKCGEIKEKIE